jgi:hypothetical protein
MDFDRYSGGRKSLKKLSLNLWEDQNDVGL